MEWHRPTLQMEMSLIDEGKPADQSRLQERIVGEEIKQEVGVQSCITQAPEDMC